MIIIGIDFHPVFQQIASADTNSGEFQEKRLAHMEAAERFYRALANSEQKGGMQFELGEATPPRSRANQRKRTLVILW